MTDDGPRNRPHWPYMLMAASAAGLILAVGLCVTGFRDGYDLQSFATASILLFIISVVALVFSILKVIFDLANR